MRLIDKFQTKEQHASELGVVPRTIDGWLKLDDPIPSYKVGLRRLFKVEETEKWLERRKVVRNPERRRGRRAA